MLNLIERIGVKAMLKFLDDLSLRLTGATSPHRNQTGNCAEHAVKMAQPLSKDNGIVYDDESWDKNCRSLGVSDVS